MLVVAHRGAGALFPENSLTAFRNVAATGADGAECDVHLSADGHLMVMHDRSLKRTTGVDGEVGDFTRMQLARLDVGDGQGVPTLEEVLEATPVALRVEMKEPDTLDALVDFVDAHPEWRERIVVTSFHHGPLLALRRRLPDVATVPLLAGYPVHPGRVAQDAGSDTLGLQFAGVTEAYVDLCHREGVKLTVWTPNEEADIRRMIALGVDGITSDRPDRVVKLLGRGS